MVHAGLIWDMTPLYSSWFQVSADMSLETWNWKFNESILKVML